MITNSNLIVYALVCVFLTSSLSALESHQDVQLRIHAPFSDLYAEEKDDWMVRVENHGKDTIPVPDGSFSLNEEQPPPQFQVQTEAEAKAGKRPQVYSWDEIEIFGNGLKEMVDKSVLDPGQTMEAFSRGLTGQLRTPPKGGKFRVAMQVGPDDFVYSNWITRTRHDEPATNMRTLHVDEPWGDGAECQIRISEGTRPNYLWFFTSGPSSSLLYRICEIPEGMEPDIQIDQERGQYVIAFPQGGPATTYFAHRCGLTKSTPWPKGYRSKDFLLKSNPISAPSPIGFPVALFHEDPPSGADHRNRPTIASERTDKEIPKHVLSKAKKTGDVNWSTLLVYLTAILIFVGIVICLICMKKRVPK